MSTQELQQIKKRELYYAALGKLASVGMLDRAFRGDFPGCPPVGYRSSSFPSGPRVVVDEKLAHFVQEAFHMAADPSLSLRQILSVVTERGLVSRSGKKLGASALLHLLLNPFYTGRIRYDGQLLPGNHLPLVDDELFFKVLSVRRSRTNKKRLTDK